MLLRVHLASGWTSPSSDHLHVPLGKPRPRGEACSPDQHAQHRLTAQRRALSWVPQGCAGYKFFPIHQSRSFKEPTFISLKTGSSSDAFCFQCSAHVSASTAFSLVLDLLKRHQTHKQTTPMCTSMESLKYNERVQVQAASLRVLCVHSSNTGMSEVRVVGGGGAERGSEGPGTLFF